MLVHCRAHTTALDMAEKLDLYVHAPCCIVLRELQNLSACSRLLRDLQNGWLNLQVVVIVDGVTKKAAEIAAVKDDAEKDLAAAKPALDAALSALNSITQKDIVGLKALKNPPDIVKRIFDCVLLLR